MNAVINNFRGISSAALDLSKICLISAQNGCGKTSTLQALAAALTGEVIPMLDDKGKPRLLRTQAGVLVRSGTANAKIILTNANGTAEVSWPTAKIKTTGQPPTASHFAAGLRSIVTMDTKDLTIFLIDYLKANPTKEHLKKALDSLGLPEATIDRLWELVQAQGWDGAYAQVKEKGAKLKGQWELVTNDNYGSKKAEEWIPEGYAPDLDGASEDTLKRCVTDAKDALEAAISYSAVDDSKRGELQELADLITVRTANLEECRRPLPENAEFNAAAAKLATMRITVADAEKALNELPLPGKKPEVMCCPSCKTELVLDGKTLTRPTPVDPIENTARQKRIDAKREECSKLRADLNKMIDDNKALSDAETSHQAEHVHSIREAERLVKESSDAADVLAKPATVSAAGVEACRQAVAAAELRLKAFTAKHEADRLHVTIELNQKMLVNIAPTGVRADVLTEALKEFNIALKQVSDTARWPVVEITPEFQIAFGGTLYALISRAQQWMTRTMIQVTMAVREKSSMMLIDDADFLVAKADRNKLFTLINHTGIPCALGMAMEKKGDVPNLASAGMGYSYWVEAGVAGEI